MPVGTVKWYDPDKGFGFVAREEGGSDLFLHHTVLGGELLAEGDRISFNVGYGLKGERAEDVQMIERSGNQPRTRRPQEYGDSGYQSRRPSGSNGGSFDRRPAVDPATLPRLEGVVRRFDADRGFGFISSAGASEDVFFHGSVVVGGAVNPGDAVEFRLGQGLRGPRAQEVRLLAPAR
jgi:cold shock CspA family protein